MVLMVTTQSTWTEDRTVQVPLAGIRCHQTFDRPEHCWCASLMRLFTWLRSWASATKWYAFGNDGDIRVSVNMYTLRLRLLWVDVGLLGRWLHLLCVNLRVSCERRQ